MSSPSPRRPVDLRSLDAHVQSMKLRQGVELPEGKRKVPLGRDLFIPKIQAEVGSAVPIGVYRFRLLVPVAQITRESSHAIRRVVVATMDEIEEIQDTFVRHFGGVTVHYQIPGSLRG